jgi:hypothetical protein
MSALMVLEENYDYYAVFNGDYDMVMMMTMMRNSDIKRQV